MTSLPLAYALYSMLADEEQWKEIASRGFVDAARSHSWLARALYIPWLTDRRNVRVQYVLLQRRDGKF